jgi:hypothetical protein
MKATVVMINPRRGMVAAQTSDGEYVIIELLGNYDIEIGHVISHHDFTSMGSENYLNITTGEIMDVYVQNICGNVEQARKQCLF